MGAKQIYWLSEAQAFSVHRVVTQRGHEVPLELRVVSAQAVWRGASWSNLVKFHRQKARQTDRNRKQTCEIAKCNDEAGADDFLMKF